MCIHPTPADYHCCCTHFSSVFVKVVNSISELNLIIFITGQFCSSVLGLTGTSSLSKGQYPVQLTLGPLCLWQCFVSESVSFRLLSPKRKYLWVIKMSTNHFPPFLFTSISVLKKHCWQKVINSYGRIFIFTDVDYWLLDVTFKDCWNVQVKARKQRVRLADWSWKGFDCLTEPPPALSTLYHSWLLTMYVTQWCASLVTTATILLPPKSPGFGSATRVSTTLCSCKHMQLLGKDGVSKTDEFSEKFQKGGGSFSIQKFMLQNLDL